MEKAKEYLIKKNLARTPCRIEVLNALIDSDSALSELEIRSKLSCDYDRTTIYRTLKSFLAQDVIHAISLDGKEVKYAITSLRDHRHSNHVHFYCMSCFGVYCISNKEIKLPELPDGFVVDNYDVLINGRCSKC